jgi:hypothetical protein
LGLFVRTYIGEGRHVLGESAFKKVRARTEEKLSTETKTYSAIALKQTEIHDLVIEMIENEKHQLTMLILFLLDVMSSDTYDKNREKRDHVRLILKKTGEV